MFLGGIEKDQWHEISYRGESYTECFQGSTDFIGLLIYMFLFETLNN